MIIYCKLLWGKPINIDKYPALHKTVRISVYFTYNLLAFKMSILSGFFGGISMLTNRKKSRMFLKIKTDKKYFLTSLPSVKIRITVKDLESSEAYWNTGIQINVQKYIKIIFLWYPIGVGDALTKKAK